MGDHSNNLPLDALSWEVMDATADDWESLEQILSRVHRFYGPSESVEVAEVIARLVRDELMEEMRHATVDPAAIMADPIEFWFQMTPRGRAAWAAASSEFAGDDT